MPHATVNVEPADATFIGWDIRLNSWKADISRLIWHKLEWEDNNDGTFTGTSGDLPSGVLGVRCAVIGPGRSVSLAIEGEPEIVQPHGAEWPMTVKVDASSATQNSDTWYFAA